MNVGLVSVKTTSYDFSSRILLLSGDVELNPGPSNKNCTLKPLTSPPNFNSLLETRLSQLGRTALDVGGGGDCFFRAVSHQIYGDPNNHFYVRSVGIQYLVLHPEHFVESNTDRSWQGYLQRMSCQGTWADAIIIQAVANCLNFIVSLSNISAQKHCITERYYHLKELFC